MGFQPTGRTPEQRDKDRRAVRKSGLRAIDQGTKYDCAGGLRRLARAIDAGEYGGDVKCVLVGITHLIHEDGVTVWNTSLHGFGKRDASSDLMTTEIMRARILKE